MHAHNTYLDRCYIHLQVLIQESSEKRFIGIGVVWEDYGCHVMPGWQHGTVGYHVDDGKIFDARNETTGKEIEGKEEFILCFLCLILQ